MKPYKVNFLADAKLVRPIAQVQVPSSTRLNEALALVCDEVKFQWLGERL